MKAIDKAHKSLERRSYYEEEFTQKDVNKALILVGLYVLCLITVTAWVIYTEMQ